MPTIDLGAPPPAPPSTGLTDLPRRLTVTLPELQLLAEYAGGAPLPFELVEAAPAPGLGDRLGQTSAATDARAYERVLSALPEPRSSLARRGLLVDTVVDEGLLGAVGLLATPRVAVDLEVRVGGARVRAWHRQHGTAVATLATSDGIVFEIAWFPVERWADELSRVALLPDGVASEDPRITEVDLPYELLDAASEAVRSGRGDLVPVLVSDHAGLVIDAAGQTLSELDVLTLLDELTTQCRGRLRAMVAEVAGESPTVVGVVSWALLADGWRALRPRRVGSVERVIVHRVAPGDLRTELAPVLAEVTR